MKNFNIVWLSHIYLMVPERKGRAQKLAKLEKTNIPSSSTTSEISLIIFSTNEKAIARFRCFNETVSALDEELLEVSYFR